MPPAKVKGPRSGQRNPVPKLVEFTVTEEIMAKAIRKSSGHCAVSDAANAAIPGARCETDLQTITLSLRDKGIRVAYLTPPVAQQALVDFDNGAPMRPFKVGLRREDAIQVRSVQYKKPDGKRQNRALPGAGVGKRTTVEVGATRVAPTGQSRIPPLGVLANRKGRVRRYGLRQLETQKAEAEAARTAAEAPFS